MSSIDPQNTQVVLIGTSIYKKGSGFDNLPGVKGNILELAKLLADPNICNIPEKNITRLLNRRYPSDVVTKLAELARQAKDTLIVYYAGHGNPAGSPPELYLTTANTTDADTQFNGLSFEKVRSAIRESGARKKILILDCCYSGRVVNTMAGQADIVKNKLNIKGTYTIAATPPNKEAIAPPDEAYTAFTGILLHVLKEGIDEGPEYISLKEIFQQIRTECGRRPELPEPVQENVQDGGDILLARNKKYKARAPSKPYIIQGLDTLRKRIAKAAIPSSSPGQTLNVATWNLRNFGRSARSEAAIFYIAELIRQFDIVAVTELISVPEMDRVMTILGRPKWDLIYSGRALGQWGNREITAFVYNTEVAQSAGQVGQATPFRILDRNNNRLTLNNNGLTSFTPSGRSPFYARFRSGLYQLMLVAVHIIWGGDPRKRKPELKQLAEWIREFQGQPDVADIEMVVLGQFNADPIDGPLYNILTSTGLKLAPPLVNMKGSNINQTHNFDLILYYPRQHELCISSGGALDYFQDDWESLFPRNEYPELDFRKFTYEMSDHLPVWVQIQFKETE